ncbi:carbohydrate ABC transporter permease [Myceligenerans xiligouense]|uniref:Raffinose/stachyose/melibiose transport system permease protein n=1 Tax=Myceligenerans xiligouense TaxID=253184 RepID=A0A3N4YLI6_9MICO|nr:sugar ABC transporter permease [Myceligenerans xiligouense]RPF20184.1 raffinose/stachyose/melibiose transport system permease protein [Myceligenerans xiligouense]
MADSTSILTARRSRAGRRPRAPRRGRAAWVGYLPYLLPGAVAFAVVIGYPLLSNVYFSLFKWRGGMAPLRWNGLGNYADLLGDDQFWTSFGNSLAMIVAMVLVPTIVGLLLAAVLFDYLGRRFGERVSSVLRATYYLPQILPVAVAGVLWNWILNSQTGALNEILRGMGIDAPPNWLGDPATALPAVMLVLIWIQIGYPVVIFMAALQRVDPELYEAAELDGAGWWHRFRAITVPQIRPETFVVTLTCTVAALKVFAPIYVLTRGGPESSTLVPSYYSYLNFFDKSQVGYGAAIATVLTLVIVVLAVIILGLQGRAERREREGI